jgi:hypothetical protein
MAIARKIAGAAEDNRVMDLNQAVIARRGRVPLPEPAPGDGAAVTRQLDAALMSAGFKLSRDLLEELSRREAGQVLDIGVTVLAAVRTMAGDHVRHNPYFRDFPFNVPATLEFWAELTQRALAAGIAGGSGLYVEIGGGELVEAGSLLSLPGYGIVQHTYEDMLAAREALAASAGDRITVLHRGEAPRAEEQALYLELAASRVPLAGEDLALLEELAAACAEGPQPERIPVRENRAVINKVALAGGRPLLADTVTDVLRLAAAVSGGDVTLETATRFRSFARPERRVIMAALDSVVRDTPAKLTDVARHAEPWKRLGERLHPHEHARFPHAGRVFAVARGEERFPSLAARAEQALREGEAARAARRLADAPGLLFRSLDRLLRSATAADRAAIMDLAAQAAPSVSGRVLLSVREHFQNRAAAAGPGLPRIFANRKGRAWVLPETRAGIDQGTRRDVLALLDEAVAARLPEGGRVIVDPAVLGVALPLSGKPAAPGLGVMPRGSVSPVVPGDQDVLSFFVYWRQQSRRTDYDLSALMVTADFARGDFVSWQAYQSADAAVTYSGDVTDAPDGATEFISCDLRRMSMPVVIPQVNIYSGEAFDEAAEAFFGYMLRGSAQRGAPFEAATVRMKSDLRGSGRVALPLAFLRGEDGRWRAKWLHFYLKGRASMNVVQDSRLSTSLLARTVIERDYLRVAHLAGLMGARTADRAFVRAATPDSLAIAVTGAPGPVTYIGLDRPEGLPEDAAVFTLANLAGLIPG